MNHGVNPRKTTRGERILIAIAYFIWFSILVLDDCIVITKCINDPNPIWILFFLVLLVATIFVVIVFLSAWEDCYDDK
jgi:hypothetical protein